MKGLRTVVAITGASGAVYGLRLAQLLTQKGYPIYLIITPAGRTVAKHELGLEIDEPASEGRDDLQKRRADQVPSGPGPDKIVPARWSGSRKKGF